MSKHILILPGDGIGPEVTAEAEKVLNAVQSKYNLDLFYEHGLIGGSAIDLTNEPLPAATLDAGKKADAILLGAVGGHKWDGIDSVYRPEKGLLAIRSELGLYANLRPTFSCKDLLHASSLKAEVIGDMDIMIVRELISGIYFGEPRGIITTEDGQRQGFNTLRYTEFEIERIAHTAFNIAMQRNKKLCSVDKANVLEATALWRQVMTDVSYDYPEVNMQHMYVDNAAMQLVRDPEQFDVIVTSNMFGDILSDLASMLTGSIGMLPSASLNATNKGLYEPVHGSAPDIAGKNIANPLAAILSVAMMLEYSLAEPEHAQRIRSAVQQVLAAGLRTADIYSTGMTQVTTLAMGNAVVKALA